MFPYVVDYIAIPVIKKANAEKANGYEKVNYQKEKNKKRWPDQ